MLPSQRLQAHRTAILAMFSEANLPPPKVFGSIARREDTDQSDVDILVEARPDTSEFTLSGLNFELEQLLGVHVDLLTSRQVPAAVLPTILAEARPI